MTADVTTKILEQIRADIAELRVEFKREIGAVKEQIKGLDERMTLVEYALRGMATHVALIPELARVVANHEDRLTRLET